MYKIQNVQKIEGFLYLRLKVQRINALRINDEDDSSVQVTINDVMYTVPKTTMSGTSLNTFIREEARLKGTKSMCLEGGCGACIVAAEVKGRTMSVNSCLVPVIMCDGWKITTIEGLGNRRMGYHILQTALASMNGSQCGFCSPAWIMSMHSLMQNGRMTMEEIENSFASNICRCTGYRPILDTFKSFASDAPPAMKQNINDIEEAYQIKSCKSCPKKTCNGTCQDVEVVYKSSIPRPLDVILKDFRFYKVLKVDEIFGVLVKHSESSYVLNGGNTAHGVYRLPKKHIYIDINDIPELSRIDKEKDTLTLGGNITLSMAKKSFEMYSKEPGFEYLKRMAKHVDLVANVPVRNIGTIAGNLMMKNRNHEFPSDIFLILETAGAQLHILDAPGSKTSLTLKDFMEVDMDRKLIYSVVLPALDKQCVYKTYKVMPRAQNAHAIVNAGFCFKLDGQGKVLEKPNIIFGGIRPDFLHASKTEEFLNGKSIYDSKTLKAALNLLNTELNPDHVLPDFTPEYRRLLAVCLLYKYVLFTNPKKAKARLRSGCSILRRELSSGKRHYETDNSIWPANQSIPKLEGLIQTSGESEYVNDLIIRENEVFCALTLADTVGPFDMIDFEEAMDIDGVIAFYSAKDVPGPNLFVNKAHSFFFLWENETFLADEKIEYAGQMYGIIVATSQSIAQYAASKVKLVYSEGPKQKPIVTIHDSLASNDETRVRKIQHFPAKQPAGTDIKFNIKGSQSSPMQYHFSMEPQTCVCIPVDNGMEVFSSTQWLDFTQTSIACILGVPTNSITVKVRRLGGAYGAKISRATHVACACALASAKLNRPARLVLTIEDNMRTIGKRPDAYMEYDLSVNGEGKIQEMKIMNYLNVGASFNDSTNMSMSFNFYNCYDFSTWDVEAIDVITDIPGNTWCRAPATPETISMIEHVMDRIARVTGKDPVAVRLVNMTDSEKNILEPMINEIKKSSDYDSRMKDVGKFNADNRWKKRGISVALMKFPLELWGQYSSLVSIFARDGTVSITHGGIEMGQGLNTKVAQVAAHVLGIDVKMINVNPSYSFISPNNYMTGGAHASDTCGYATKMACLEILKRLEPIKEALGGNPTWQELTLAAHFKDVDLSATYMYTNNQDEIGEYFVYAVAIAEVEVDMLTGQHLVRRVDLVEDTGISLNPEIDIGQIEGSFVMGMGFWTTEDVIHDPETGVLTNYRTWNYKVPGAKDIPMDFRVTLNQKLPNSRGILRSKSTGEPPFCLSCCVPMAIREALNSARADAGNKDLWFQLDNTVTPEKILLASLTNIDMMEY
ncbi:hypothetical protein QAD02_012239 [Eretmocerus hayati]|uniref:Uncharacterized protein n=1 Tax=Eretmocerus hayati TaxID=131215 RepID=A0ACC2P1W9_9HYME|nr:hypothetical protein QAD02_012239 [Eretmocerus hayati]